MDEHCLIMEKVADMIAWLPTIDASVAMTNTGQNTGSTQKFQKQETKERYKFKRRQGEFRAERTIIPKNREKRKIDSDVWLRTLFGYLELICRSSILWHPCSWKEMQLPQCRKASDKDRRRT